MCGIAGLWTGGPSCADAARAMADTLAHRGPDDGGVWSDPAVGVALSHRRLSIIDPSPCGRQPMASRSGRYILTFNGEIYNHLDLRRELDADDQQGWRGGSDTETLLAAVARWGLDETLRRTSGMFALGLWDCAERRLALARDRMGEKPLYYGWTGNGFAFASELKALAAVPGATLRTDPDALALFLRHNYVPTPWSIFADIYKLEPGATLVLDARAVSAPPSGPVLAETAVRPGLACRRYWSLGAVIARGADEDMTADEAVAGLERTLTAAVRRQMIADVPLGAFLSGGVDSSAVVALMTTVASSRVRTFTIGFAEGAFDEAPFARAVARHLGTDHHETVVTARDVQAIVPDLPAIYDEPFADSSQLPTALLARMTRRSVTVALSGDGGDELFCGYNRYLVPRRAWDRAASLPPLARRALARGIEATPPGWWRAAARLPFAPAVTMPDEKARKVARVLRTPMGARDLYRSSSEEWSGAAPTRAPGRLPSPAERDATRASAEEQMMEWDQRSYLPDDILTKVDRAAMAASLETRVPLLDHAVIEQAWRTPLRHKKRDGTGKWALRQLLYRHIPASLIERPKAGFAAPVGSWLRGPLRDWAETLLAKDALARWPELDPAPIRARWAQHMTGTHDWTASLWGVLMLQAWRERWGGGC